MRIKYDPQHDLLNIEFLEGEAISESVELDGLIVDYTADGRIAAIEILDAGKRTTKDPLDVLNVSISRGELQPR